MPRRPNLVTTLKRSLSGRASTLLLERMVKLIEQSPEDASELARTIAKIRASIRLFVNEELAETVDSELRNQAGLPSRAGPAQSHRSPGPP